MCKLMIPIISKSSTTLVPKAQIVPKARNLQFVMGCLLAGCLLTGCQKPDKSLDEANNPISRKVSEVDRDKDTKITTNVSNQATTTSDSVNTSNKDVNDQPADKLLDNRPNNTSVSDALAPEPSPSAKDSAASLEKQVTTVDYRSAGGQTLKVTFQTSALEALEADVRLPSGSRVILTAPEGQGNNPTYRSADGSIELVTHGGGGSIDLIFDGNQTQFDAINAEAKVVSLS